MKKLLFTVFSVALVAFSSSAQETKVKKEDDKLKAKQTSMEGKETKIKKEEDKVVIKGEGVGKDLVYPYKATYSSQFAPGAPAHAKLVLDLWKDWDDNALDRNAALVADTVLFELPNGEVIRGKDSFMVVSKRHRDNLTTVKSTVEAFMPIKSVDRNEDFVLVWGKEEVTDKDGKASSRMLHEIWGINKDGKVVFLRQYTAKPTMQ